MPRGTAVEKLTTTLDGLLLLQSVIHGDERGFFSETFRKSTLLEHGIAHDWVQDNHSRSVQGVTRGLHFQLGEGQAKLVRCASGRIFDVVVDIRRESDTYGRWEGVTLDDESGLQLYVPVGFAHGFCVLSEAADVLYKCSSYYDPSLERAIAYDDPDIGIDWPDLELIVSERDRAAPRLAEIADELRFEPAP